MTTSPVFSVYVSSGVSVVLSAPCRLVGYRVANATPGGNEIRFFDSVSAGGATNANQKFVLYSPDGTSVLSADGAPLWGMGIRFDRGVYVTKTGGSIFMTLFFN